MTTADKVSLPKYWEMLCQFDWFYDFSDDLNTWERGKRDHEKIEAIANQSPEHKKLFEDFKKHMSSGPAYGTERLPRPERPEE